ncbi:MAG TPA: hypothetical protein VGA49_03715 [Patescibacteria group bacterium]
MQDYRSKQETGLVALISVIIITVITLGVGVTISLLGLSELQAGLTLDQSSRALETTDSCGEEAYFRLKLDSGYTGGTVPVGTDSCTATVSGGGASRTITTISTVSDHTRATNVNVDLTTNTDLTAEGIDLTGWGEE